VVVLQARQVHRHRKRLVRVVGCFADRLGPRAYKTLDHAHGTTRLQHGEMQGKPSLLVALLEQHCCRVRGNDRCYRLHGIAPAERGKQQVFAAIIMIVKKMVAVGIVVLGRIHGERALLLRRFGRSWATLSISRSFIDERDEGKWIHVFRTVLYSR
jgi:hypothetical protein